MKIGVFNIFLGGVNFSNGVYSAVDGEPWRAALLILFGLFAAFIGALGVAEERD